MDIPHPLNHGDISVERVNPACITVKELYSTPVYFTAYSDCTFRCREK
jgi:hypothetical protein